MDTEQRRRTDTWVGKCANLWDWFDGREIDKHLASLAVFGITWKITDWLMAFVAAHPDKSGIEVAAIVGAFMVPWSAAQAYALKFYFDARTKE